jgi:hypothetical protein
MTPFYKRCLYLWGGDWKKEIEKVLKKHGHNCSRQKLWRWQKEGAPEWVGVILKKERRK